MTSVPPAGFASAPPRNGRARGAPPFLLAIIAGIAAHLVALALFRVTLPPTRASAPPPPYASYPRAAAAVPDAARDLEARLFDPAQLYLPAALERAPSEQVHPLALFSAEPANVTLRDEDFPIASLAINPQPADVLKPRQWDVLGALGQAESELTPLPRRGAWLQVRRLDASPTTRAEASAFNWPESKAPPIREVEWRPATFLVQFDDKGLADEPALDSSSRSEEVDRYLRAELRRWFARHPLRAGLYEVVVGP